MVEKQVKSFTIWKHFKGSRAFFNCCKDSKTGEDLVIYQCLDNAGKTNHRDGIYASPLKMFLSEIDHEKYPEASQKFRFEEIQS